MKSKSRKSLRQRRHRRIRRRVSGTAERPRMAIMKSNRQMYVQFIDDDVAVTLASASTLGAGDRLSVDSARKLGLRAAEVAREKGIKRVVVDRGGFLFHGRVKAVVDAAVEGGLEIRGTPAAQPRTAPGQEDKEAS